MALLLAMIWFVVLCALIVNGYTLFAVIWVGMPIAHFAHKVSNK